MTSLRVLPGSAGTAANENSNAPRLELVPSPASPDESKSELYMLAYLEGMESHVGRCPLRSQKVLCERLERMIKRVSGH